MTNKERLISILGFSPESNALEGEMLDVGISGTDSYETKNGLVLKKCAIKIMEILLSTADTTNSVSGFTIRYDRAAIEKRIVLFKTELGLIDESQPFIKSVSPW